MSTLDKISALLKEQKKTQKDLMDYLGLEKSTYTTWKSKKVNNKSYKKYIKEIAEFLNVSTDYLLCDTTDDIIEDDKQKRKELFYLGNLPEVIKETVNNEKEANTGHPTNREQRRKFDNKNLSFALFGTADVDEEVLDDVRKYAAIARRMREEQKKED